jgi:phenylpyruvate tautomerase PptA (4-oxalocrotonate tautomerase family)
MPIYSWTAEEGVFSEDQKTALAKVVTDIHERATGAPRGFVRSFFATYPKGSGFLGEAVSPTVFLHCHIRAGRSMEVKQSMLKQLNQAAEEIGNISSDDLAIIIDEIPPGCAMEFGLILPGTTPQEEAAWLRARELSGADMSV